MCKTTAGVVKDNDQIDVTSTKFNLYGIYRYTLSQADVQVFDQVGKAPAASLPHALRWYNQIASYTPAERKAWPAGANPLTAGGKPTTPAPVKKEEEDDDDVDLFGSGDEEEVRKSNIDVNSVGDIIITNQLVVVIPF